MGQERRLLLVLVYTSVWCACVQAYMNGAGRAACQTLDPGANHGSQGPDPVPYQLVIVGSTSYTDTKIVNVLVRGSKAFKGIMVQARRKGNTDDWRPLGAFSVPNNSTGMRLMTCVKWGDTITHIASYTELNNVVFTWIAPMGDSGDVEFVANVIQDITWWYNNVKSATLTYVMPTTTTTTTTTTMSTSDTGGTAPTSVMPSGALSPHNGYHTVLAMTFVLVACIFGQ